MILKGALMVSLAAWVVIWGSFRLPVISKEMAIEPSFPSRIYPAIGILLTISVIDLRVLSHRFIWMVS